MFFANDQYHHTYRLRVAEIWLTFTSIVSCYGTTGPVVVPFSRLLWFLLRPQIFGWGESPNLAWPRRRLVLCSELDRHDWPLSRFSFRRRVPRAVLASGIGIALVLAGRESLFLIKIRLFCSSSSN